MIYRIRRNNKGQYMLGISVFHDAQSDKIYLDFIFFHVAVEWDRH